MITLSRRALLGTSAALVPALAMRRARAASAMPVKIGVLCDFSGPYADDTGTGLRLAVSLAAQDSGAGLHRPVEILSADDHNKPDVGAAVARRWLGEENVQAIVCGSASSITLAIADLVREKNAILLVSGSMSSDLTGKACGPTSFQFGFDTYASARSVIQPSVAAGLTSWYFINVDYAFGHSLRRDGEGFVAQAGGKTVGSTAFPLNTADFSSFLLQARASGAKAIGLACGGSDWTNLVKQAHEFGVDKSGQTLVSLASGFNEVVAAGLESAQGMMLATPFYWNMNDATRAFAGRFMSGHNGVPPNWQQACGYSAALHYLKAVQAAGKTDGASVAKAMRGMKVQDFTVEGAAIRQDGQVMRPSYLARVKAPGASHDKNDAFEVVRLIAPEETWRPANESACPLLRQA
ncbi:MAG TPA: ABC transporter substrate-binding protein [Acetobacteraceae bacterium]|nr:ABC transporter substrate-binding protein [Acetobacteraceae bacterium]